MYEGSSIPIYQTHETNMLLKDLAAKGLSYWWVDGQPRLPPKELALLPTVSLVLSQFVNNFSQQGGSMGISIQIDKRTLFDGVPMSDDQRKRKMATFEKALDLMGAECECVYEKVKSSIYKVSMLPTITKRLNSYRPSNKNRLDPKRPIQVPAVLYTGIGKDTTIQAFTSNMLACFDYALGLCTGPQTLTGGHGLAHRYLLKSYRRYREERKRRGYKGEYIDREVRSVLGAFGIFTVEEVNDDANLEDLKIQVSSPWYDSKVQAVGGSVNF